MINNIFELERTAYLKMSVSGTKTRIDAYVSRRAGVLSAAHRGMTLAEAVMLGNAAATVSLNAQSATGAMTTLEECIRITDGFGRPETVCIPD